MALEAEHIPFIPICTECIHCSEYNDALACFRKKTRIDPVDGSEIFPKPKICRIERAEMAWAWWACGRKGKFFEQRIDMPGQEGMVESTGE